jgi:hypothetical protein
VNAKQMKSHAAPDKTPENAVNLQLLGSYETATSSQTTPMATEAETPKSPPENAHAPQERGDAADGTPQPSIPSTYVKLTERELIDWTRRGMAKYIELEDMISRLKRWRPGNDEIIERVVREIWEFECRMGNSIKWLKYREEERLAARIRLSRKLDRYHARISKRTGRSW